MIDEKQSSFPRRSLIGAVLAGACLWAAGSNTTQWRTSTEAPAQAKLHKETKNRPRYVSLSPGVTDTLVQIGVGRSIVGISDYCAWTGNQPARIGSSITPNYEKIAHLGPTQILASKIAGDQLAPLSKLAPTTSFPWLTQAEMISSIRKIGSIVSREKRATELSNQVNDALSQPAPDGAPRVLLALDYGDTGSKDTWFIRTNSIHGAVLRAAGGTNAIETEVTGQPKLSPEQLLKADPDIIVVLFSREIDQLENARATTHFKEWTPLSAVRNRRIGVLGIPHALSVGPSVVSLIQPLRKKIDELAQVSDTSN